MRSTIATATLLLGLAQPAVASSNPECIAMADQAPLCTVDASTHSYTPPNQAIDGGVRGVYWIDAGPDKPGYTNPWVDLNMLQPFPPSDKHYGKFWIMDATPMYQSWQDVEESYPYVSNLMKMGSRSIVDPMTLEVTWETCLFSCGKSWEFFVPTPLSSPSEKVGENEYIRKAVVFGKTVSTWAGYRIIDENGDKTEFFDKMVEANPDVIMIPGP